ncbi:MAG: hypothetical protein HRU09_09180 [Oligoflexales bacterium]|nr:hypothetical protein [Oligoflexales bacterium]
MNSASQFSFKLDPKTFGKHNKMAGNTGHPRFPEIRASGPGSDNLD